MTKEDVFNIDDGGIRKKRSRIAGGINNTFTYGNWSLNIMFSYSVGQQSTFAADRIR